MMLIVLTCFSGLAADLSFYTLVLVVYTMVHGLGMSYSWIRLVSVGVHSYLFLTVVFLAALLVCYIRWFFNVLSGFWAYHQVVIETKHLLETDAR